MDVFDFNIEVVSRFLSDCNIPIKTVKQSVFVGEMETLGYWDKWVEFVEMVNRDFSGDPKKFLDYYYQKREEMIQALQNEHYESFNNCNMEIFTKIPNAFKGVSKSVWNGSNSKGTFISFDLKTANFQALKYVNPAIVLNCETWDEFCRKFTDCKYILESKYIRQVVFGQLNPGRHTTVEKHMMGIVYDYLENHGIVGGLMDRNLFTLCAVCVDELVFKVDETVAQMFVKTELYQQIESAVRANYGFNIKTTVFSIDEYHLRAHNAPNSSGKDVCMFFVKNDLVASNVKLMCVPQTYYGIVWKLANGMEVDDNSRHFVYEGLDCVICEEFHIEDCEKNVVQNIF